MRLRFEFTVTNNEIPLDYRRIIISFFKKSLEKNGEDTILKYYRGKDPIQKDFTFSVYFDSPVFKKDIIEIKNNSMIINFSTSNYETGVDFYNSMIKMMNYAFEFKDNNYIILKNIVSIKERLTSSDSVLVKTLSPILIREHNKDSNYDNYLLISDDNFQNQIKQTLLNIVNKKDIDITKDDLESFEIIDINKSKEVKVLYYGHKVNGNIGKFLLKGKPTIINYLIQSGIGSRTSSGFGMIEIEGVVN